MRCILDRNSAHPGIEADQMAWILGALGRDEGREVTANGRFATYRVALAFDVIERSKAAEAVKVATVHVGRMTPGGAWTVIVAYGGTDGLA